VNSPIADRIEDDMHLASNGGEPTEAEMSERHRRHHANLNVTNVPQDQSYLTDLINAQQDLIAAQHRFLQEGDQRGLLTAQQQFLQVQTSVIGRLGVFG
jgi:hypothetical protein